MASAARGIGSAGQWMMGAPHLGDQAVISIKQQGTCSQDDEAAARPS